MNRPWDHWDDTDDPQTIQRRWIGLSRTERARFATEAGITVESFERFVLSLLD